MSILFNLFNVWAVDEDDELWDKYYNLYGPLLEISFTFPSWRRSKLPVSLAVLCFFAFIFPVHIWLLTVGINCVRDDFNLASMIFHYWLIVLFSSVGILLMNNNRGSMVLFHKKLTRDVGQHEPGRIYDEYIPMQLEHDKRKQLLQFIFLPAFVLVLAGATLMIPYLTKMDGEVLYNNRGVNMKLPIPLWYPFPTHEGILSLLAVFGQFLCAGGLSAVIAALDFIIFRATQTVIFECRVLQYAIDTLVPRARRLYTLEYPTMDMKKVQMTDDAFQRCIGKCLRACVIHHQDINTLTKLYKTMIKWPGFMAYGIGTGVIGLSLVNILSAKENGDFENIILFLGLALAEVLNMFMISVFCEAITTECIYKLDTMNRKLMLGFQMGINEPVVIKVGGIVAATLDTFSSIMNTSYSFFNLVNAK